MFTVTAEPTQAFVDAISTRLRADTDTGNPESLVSLMGTGKVFGHLSEAARTAYPYLVLGRTSLDRNAGAMQIAGANVTLQIDVWSAYKGAYQARRILSRVSALLERYRLIVTNFAMVDGSLTCELSEVFDEPDEDKPGERLYHGVQRWTAEIHEAA